MHSEDTGPTSHMSRQMTRGMANGLSLPQPLKKLVSERTKALLTHRSCSRFYLIMQTEGLRVPAIVNRPCLGSIFVEKSTKTKMNAAYTSPMNACTSRHLS